MRRVFIDENLSHALVQPLSAAHRRGVRFRSAKDEGQLGVPDAQLIGYLGRCGFGLIVTNDRAQIDLNPEERAELVAAGMSWLGVPHLSSTGARLISDQLAIVTSAVARILAEWPERPTAYRLRALGDPFDSVHPL